MSKGFVFSWAEDANGKIVHVDSVPNGLKCKCYCPHCHEQLLARHGEINEHGFAHHSENRGANLKICYMVILYKLAEHILQTKKRIHVPSYYGIYKETDIEFTDVKIDSRYERDDKQPDVIATTKDNQKYLIEFTFQYKVQHKRDIDYHNLTCLEINLSGQTLETLEDFLINSSKDRRWINNENYFKQIETTYQNANKPVRVVPETDCCSCELERKNLCCAIKSSIQTLMQIKNNGQTYRICKVEKYKYLIEKIREQRLIEERRKEKKHTKITNSEHKEYIPYKRKVTTVLQSKVSQEKEHHQFDNTNESQERSCFNCEINLAWANKGGMANCGCYQPLNIPKSINPDYAKGCKMFKKINK